MKIVTKNFFFFLSFLFCLTFVGLSILEETHGSDMIPFFLQTKSGTLSSPI